MNDTTFRLALPLLPTDTNEKCTVGRGQSYRGTWSMSHSGAECINWNSTSLRGRKFTARKMDASGLGLGNHNFCRYVPGAIRGEASAAAHLPGVHVDEQDFLLTLPSFWDGIKLLDVLLRQTASNTMIMLIHIWQEQKHDIA